MLVWLKTECIMMLLQKLMQLFSLLSCQELWLANHLTQLPLLFVSLGGGN